MNQSAISMLQKTIELMSKEICIDLMPEMIPPLLTVNLLNIFLFDSLQKNQNSSKVWDANSQNLTGTTTVSA